MRTRGGTVPRIGVTPGFADICIGADVTLDDMAFGAAMECYQRTRHRQNPTAAEVLAVARSQGWRKIMSQEDERHGHQHDVEERHEIIRRLSRLERKLDVLLKSAVDEKEIAALTAELSADDAELQASVDKAKAAAPPTR